MGLLGSPAGLATQSICCIRRECPIPAHPRWAWCAVGEKWRRGVALEPKAKHVGAPATIRNAAMIMAARCKVKDILEVSKFPAYERSLTRNTPSLTLPLSKFFYGKKFVFSRQG